MSEEEKTPDKPKKKTTKEDKKQELFSMIDNCKMDNHYALKTLLHEIVENAL